MKRAHFKWSSCEVIITTWSICCFWSSRLFPFSPSLSCFYHGFILQMTNFLSHLSPYSTFSGLRRIITAAILFLAEPFRHSNLKSRDGDVSLIEHDYKDRVMQFFSAFRCRNVIAEQTFCVFLKSGGSGAEYNTA